MRLADWLPGEGMIVRCRPGRALLLSQTYSVDYACILATGSVLRTVPKWPSVLRALGSRRRVQASRDAGFQNFRRLDESLLGCAVSSQGNQHCGSLTAPKQFGGF
jgi:hypothetical protein